MYLICFNLKDQYFNVHFIQTQYINKFEIRKKKLQEPLFIYNYQEDGNHTKFSSKMFLQRCFEHFGIFHLKVKDA